MVDPTDSELLRLSRAGDAAAFDKLIRRHDRRLYRIARSVLVDDQEAEDVIQETFVKAFKALSGFRGSAKLSTWLTRITLNEAIRGRRRRRSLVQLEALQGRDQQLSPAPATAPEQDPEHRTAQHQIRKVLERAIDDLPDGLRTVFVMRDVEELSTAETARNLRSREATVKTRLHRARRMLREFLGEEVRASLKDVFPFEKQRCDRLVERLLSQLALI
jgi:RNA polymerase sigma-70 factor (ECF subfamily)